MTKEQETAYDTGFNLSEMGGWEEPPYSSLDRYADIYKDQPDLRALFEEGWWNAKQWQAEKNAEADA